MDKVNPASGQLRPVMGSDESCLVSWPDFFSDTIRTMNSSVQQIKLTSFALYLIALSAQVTKVHAMNHTMTTSPERDELSDGAWAAIAAAISVCGIAIAAFSCKYAKDKGWSCACNESPKGNLSQTAPDVSSRTTPQTVEGGFAISGDGNTVSDSNHHNTSIEISIQGAYSEKSTIGDSDSYQDSANSDDVTYSYESPRLTPKELQQGVKVEKPQALYALAKKNEDSALMERSADLGYRRAQLAVGEIAYKESRIGDALAWFKKAADQKLPLAQYRRGEIYLEGRGGNKRHSGRGIKYLTTAANAGFVPAQFRLGNYYIGVGNYKNASTWFGMITSKRNNRHDNLDLYREAQFHLGCCFYHGNAEDSDENAEPNYEMARKWISKSLGIKTPEDLLRIQRAQLLPWQKEALDTLKKCDNLGIDSSVDENLDSEDDYGRVVNFLNALMDIEVERFKLKHGARRNGYKKQSSNTGCELNGYRLEFHIPVTRKNNFHSSVGENLSDFSRLVMNKIQKGNELQLSELDSIANSAGVDNLSTEERKQLMESLA